MERIEQASKLVQELEFADVILDQYGCKIFRKNDDYFFHSRDDEYYKIKVDEILSIIRNYVNIKPKKYIEVNPPKNRITE